MNKNKTGPDSNNINSGNKKQSVIINVIACGLFFLLLLLVYLCNRVVVFMQDDLWYSTNLVTQQQIKEFGDILESQVWHYLNWGGRTVAHTLLQFLLWGGDTLCNIANTLFFAGLTVFLATAPRRKRDYMMVLLAGSMLVAFNPNILETLFWQSGTVNYLYMTVLMFPLVWVYLRYFKKEYHFVEGKSTAGKGAGESTETNPLNGESRETDSEEISLPQNILYAFGMFFWGLIAGWTNENMGPTLFLLTVVTEILLLRKKKKVPLWMFAGSVSLAIGCAAMILAPGNSGREHVIASLGSWKLDLCKRVIDYARGGAEYLFPLILVLIFTFVMYRLVLKKLPDMDTLMIIGCGITAYLALALSPHMPDRSIFGIMCFFIWAVLNMLSEIFVTEKKQRYRILITLFITAVALHKLFFLWAQGVGWYRYT